MTWSRNLLIPAALLLVCNQGMADAQALVQFREVMPSQANQTYNFQIKIRAQDGTITSKTISSTPSPTPTSIDLTPGKLIEITWWSSSSITPKRCETRDAKQDITANSRIKINFSSTYMQGTTQAVSGCEYIIE